MRTIPNELPTTQAYTGWTHNSSADSLVQWVTRRFYSPAPWLKLGGKTTVRDMVLFDIKGSILLLRN